MRLSDSKLNYYCLIEFVGAVIRMDLNNEESMILSLQSVYGRLVRISVNGTNSDLLGIKMSVSQQKSTHVRICRDTYYAFTIYEYKTGRYKRGNAYYIKIVHLTMSDLNILVHSAL